MHTLLPLTPLHLSFPTLWWTGSNHRWLCCSKGCQALGVADTNTNSITNNIIYMVQQTWWPRCLSTHHIIILFLQLISRWRQAYHNHPSYNNNIIAAYVQKGNLPSPSTRRVVPTTGPGGAWLSLSLESVQSLSRAQGSRHSFSHPPSPGYYYRLAIKLAVILALSRI
jgi:hypothetical protein